MWVHATPSHYCDLALLLLTIKVIIIFHVILCKIRVNAAELVACLQGNYDGAFSNPQQMWASGRPLW